MRHPKNAKQFREGFTLTELLMVMMILSLLSAMGAMVYERASQQARLQRTETIIRKIDSLLMERWDSYRTRLVNIRFPTSMPLRGDEYADNDTNGRWSAGDTLTRDRNLNGFYDAGVAEVRLTAIRQLQRWEMPEKMSDVLIVSDALAGMLKEPALRRSYLNAAMPSWTIEYEEAECLYMQIATMRDGDKRALEWFSASEIGDIDGDGMKEILDGWGTPIRFLRWAPGYTPYNAMHIASPGTYPQIVSPQSRNAIVNPDVFDPLRVDGRCFIDDPLMQPDPTNDPTTWINQVRPFALRPLIFSAGPDKKFDINLGPNDPLDPYYRTATDNYVGTPEDADLDGTISYQDNITNHDLKGN